MRVFKSYKTELDPNNVQRTWLGRYSGAARFAWNWGLADRIKEYGLTGRSINYNDQNKRMNVLKKTEFVWMLDVSKCVMQEALRDLDTAFGNFFAKRSGYPKFKRRKGNSGRFRLHGRISVGLGSIRLPKLGWVRIRDHGYLPPGAKALSATIRERNHRWFVTIRVEEEIHVSDNSGSVVGLDLGLKSFAVVSDGTVVDSPKFLDKSLKQLRKLNRRHSRKQKGSKNRRKAAKRLAKLHYRIACQRSDFLHKASTRLAKTKSVIVVEDLNVRGMVRNRNMSRAISDAGWSEFVRMLGYKTVWYGSSLVMADKFFPSTKRCSSCGTVKDRLSLKERTYHCDKCGLVLDRDLNAAKNLLSLSTGSSPGFEAYGDSPLGESSK